jgi:hypothetical protein
MLSYTINLASLRSTQRSTRAFMKGEGVVSWE